MRTVRGISFLFVGIDALGDLTSLISIFFQPDLDALGMAVYGSELALWIGVCVCGGYYNFMPWLGKKAKQSRGGEREGERGENSGETEEAEEARSTALQETDLERRSSASSHTIFRTASVQLRNQADLA